MPRTSAATEEDWLESVRVAPELAFPLFGHHQVPRDWQIRDLTITEHLIWFIEKNSCEGRVDGKPVLLEAGTLMWLAPGVKFSFRLVDAARPITLYRFRITAKHNPDVLVAPQRVRLVRKAWPVLPAMAAIVHELQTQFRFRETRLRGQALVLFATLFEMQRGAETERQLSVGQCEKLRAFVAARGNLRAAPAQLAEHLGLTLDYFSRVFRQTFGCAPREWLVGERIRNAAQRLSESHVKIGTLAEELGYPDIYSFSKQFKKVTGRSPRNYRGTVRV